MESFIDICVSDILQKHAQNFINTTVVFPSKRAMVFFKKSLEEHISQTIFLPKMTTIQDFCISRQNSSIPDDFTLIYLLYQSYTKIARSMEPLEDFYPWGEMLLADFDDIDKYNINAEAIFTNIGDLKDMDDTFSFLTEEQKAMIARFWDTTKIADNTNENDVRRKFVQFWNLLPLIYSDFKENLEKQNYCYEGMAIRNVADSIDKIDEVFGNATYIFIGFNALSKCEQKLLEALRNRKQAYFYWDYDIYYKEDISHEAGIFIRKNIKDFPNEITKDAFSNFRRNKNINIIQTPNEVAQAKICGELLSQQKNFNDTAIVLADEKLIVPIIKSIPNEIKYNITLGYPIRSSAAYTLFESILDMCNNKKGEYLYYKDILRICENSLIPSSEQTNAKKLQSLINKEKRITLSSKECSDICLGNIFSIDTNLNNYIPSLIDCIVSICRNPEIEELDKSIFYTIYTELSALKTIIEKNEISFGKISFINSLLKKSIQGKTIAIEGEPLEGLQIMGILETRMLDFKNIIMTSVMDGNLPKSSVGSSFIPYTIRTAFGMPTIKEQSAMYSYYFYRLIQRCENLTLLYCENSGENKCEKSRFILQLLYESPFKNLSANENNSNKTLDGITLETYNYNITPNELEYEQIERSRPEVAEYIEQIKNNKYLSPTALQKYIKCPKQFYYAQIRGLHKPEEIDELPRPFEIGSYIHDTIELIYKPFVGKIIDNNVIDKILQDEDAIKTQIKDVLKKNKAPQNITNPQSKEFLTILKRTKDFLESEKNKPFKIIGLETGEAQLTLENGVHISGRIDRLDFCQDVYRIIDYKTGNCTIEKLTEKLNIKNVEDLFSSDNKQKEAFQTLVYAYILHKLHPEKNYQPNLFFLQTISNEKNRTTLHIAEEEILSFEGETFKIFEENFNELINNLISTEGFFEETENDNNCSFCDFRSFCRK
ncbi:MAG: PD-(D/E)XK nuclease family protein [Bacteroidales bacterium]|nr:PD-(D/E)XK nuclease family protein [Bacteroidales bacterium]